MPPVYHQSFDGCYNKDKPIYNELVAHENISRSGELVYEEVHPEGCELQYQNHPSCIQRHSIIKGVGAGPSQRMLPDRCWKS